MDNKEVQKSKAELYRDMLRLYAGSGVYGALALASAGIALAQIAKGEHLVPAILTATTIFLGDTALKDARAGCDVWRQIRDRKMNSTQEKVR